MSYVDKCASRLVGKEAIGKMSGKFRNAGRSNAVSRLTLRGKFPQANLLANSGHDSFCCAIQWFQLLLRHSVVPILIGASSRG